MEAFKQLSTEEQRRIDINQLYNYEVKLTGAPAYCRVQELKGDLIYVKALFTLEKGHRHGCKLLDYIQHHWDGGVDILLDCEAALVAYYEKQGFKRLFTSGDIHYYLRKRGDIE